MTIIKELKSHSGRVLRVGGTTEEISYIKSLLRKLGYIVEDGAVR